jgi:hypothetical protein
LAAVAAYAQLLVELVTNPVVVDRMMGTNSSIRRVILRGGGLEALALVGRLAKCRATLDKLLQLGHARLVHHDLAAAALFLGLVSLYK